MYLLYIYSHTHYLLIFRLSWRYLRSFHLSCVLKSEKVHVKIGIFVLLASRNCHEIMSKYCSHFCLREPFRSRKHPRNPTSMPDEPSANVPSSFETRVFFIFLGPRRSIALLSLAFSIVLFPIRRPRVDPRSAFRTCARWSDASMTSLLLFPWPWQCVSRTDDSILHPSTHFNASETACVLNSYLIITNCVSQCDRYRIPNTLLCERNIQMSQKILWDTLHSPLLDTARSNMFKRT